MVSQLCLMCGHTYNCQTLCLGARPRYSLVVEEDVKKPTNQTYNKARLVHAGIGLNMAVESSSVIGGLFWERVEGGGGSDGRPWYRCLSIICFIICSIYLVGTLFLCLTVVFCGPSRRGMPVSPVQVFRFASPSVQ